MTPLDGKVALVTGASRGIGRAVALALAGVGVRLGLASRSGDDLGLEDVLARPCDVRDRDAVEEIVASTVRAFGRLDILVSNAGVGAYGPFLELPLEHLEEMVDVNARPTSSRSPPRPAGAAYRTRRSTAPRSSPRSASRARSTTSSASAASAAPTSVQAASRPTLRWAAAGRRRCPSSAG